MEAGSIGSEMTDDDNDRRDCDREGPPAAGVPPRIRWCSSAAAAAACSTPNGRSYLDLISGVGVAALGHAHPRLAAAIAAQAQELLHTSNLFFHPLQGELAARLSTLSGLPRAFFCNSGAEAVEASLKFARRYWHAQGAARAPSYVALEHSFHGRTMGALSVTWDDHYRAPFAPLIPGVTFVPADDPAALRAAVTDRTAAVIVEPIQGEGGVRPLTQAMAAAITDACGRTGALLIADEVQCGLGPHGAAVLLARRSACSRTSWRSASRSGRACRSPRRSSPTAWRPRRRSAITAAPTAATCWRAARRWCFSKSSSTAG